MDRRVFQRAQGLSGNIALRIHSLETQRSHRFTQLFFFTRSNFYMNKDLDGHDRFSVISECYFEISTTAHECRAAPAAPIWLRTLQSLVLLILQNLCTLLLSTPYENRR